MALRAFATWLCILVLAVLNGTLREFVLLPALGKPAGMVLSGLVLSGVILLVAWLALPWIGARRRPHLFAIGAGWLLATLVFEFGIGLWEGKSMAELLAPYIFADGNVWPLVLVVVVLAPWLAARWRGMAAGSRGPRS